MSNVTISGNASGTATFTVQSPATNTNRTLTLPDATGTVATEGVVIGVGQTWQDLTSSRAVSTSYQNTTGKPIMVAVDANSSTTSGRNLEVSVDNVNWVRASITNSSAGGFVTATAIVSPDHYYRINGAVSSLKYWGELR